MADMPFESVIVGDGFGDGAVLVDDQQYLVRASPLWGVCVGSEGQHWQQREDNPRDEIAFLESKSLHVSVSISSRSTFVERRCTCCLDARVKSWLNQTRCSQPIGNFKRPAKSLHKKKVSAPKKYQREFAPENRVRDNPDRAAHWLGQIGGEGQERHKAHIQS